MLKPFTTSVTRDPLEVLGDWHLYGLVVVGGTTMVLNQTAFQSGPLAAPLTALTLVDPILSVVIAFDRLSRVATTADRRVPFGPTRGEGVALARTAASGLGQRPADGCGGRA